MKKYRLIIKKYDIKSREHKIDKREILTSDIYHDIGYIVCNCIEKIEEIHFEEVVEK